MHFVDIRKIITIRFFLCNNQIVRFETVPKKTENAKLLERIMQNAPTHLRLQQLHYAVDTSLRQMYHQMEGIMLDVKDADCQKDYRWAAVRAVATSMRNFYICFDEVSNDSPSSSPGSASSPFSENGHLNIPHTNQSSAEYETAALSHMQQEEDEARWKLVKEAADGLRSLHVQCMQPSTRMLPSQPDQLRQVCDHFWQEEQNIRWQLVHLCATTLRGLYAEFVAIREQLKLSSLSLYSSLNTSNTLHDEFPQHQQYQSPSNDTSRYSETRTETRLYSTLPTSVIKLRHRQEADHLRGRLLTWYRWTQVSKRRLEEQSLRLVRHESDASLKLPVEALEPNNCSDNIIEELRKKQIEQQHFIESLLNQQQLKNSNQILSGSPKAHVELLPQAERIQDIKIQSEAQCCLFLTQVLCVLQSDVYTPETQEREQIQWIELVERAVQEYQNNVIAHSSRRIFNKSSSKYTEIQQLEQSCRLALEEFHHRSCVAIEQKQTFDNKIYKGFQFCTRVLEKKIRQQEERKLKEQKIREKEELQKKVAAALLIGRIFLPFRKSAELVHNLSCLYLERESQNRRQAQHLELIANKILPSYLDLRNNIIKAWEMESEKIMIKMKAGLSVALEFEQMLRLAAIPELSCGDAGRRTPVAADSSEPMTSGIATSADLTTTQKIKQATCLSIFENDSEFTRIFDLNGQTSAQEKHKSPPSCSHAAATTAVSSDKGFEGGHEQKEFNSLTPKPSPDLGPAIGAKFSVDGWETATSERGTAPAFVDEQCKTESSFFWGQTTHIQWGDVTGGNFDEMNPPKSVDASQKLEERECNFDIKEIGLSQPNCAALNECAAMESKMETPSSQQQKSLNDLSYALSSTRTVLSDTFPSGASHVSDDGTPSTFSDHGAAVEHSVETERATQRSEMESGISVQPISSVPVTKEQARKLAKPFLGCSINGDTYPLEVQAVYEGCPAWRAGIRVGDRLMTVNGVAVTSLSTLRRILQSADAAVTRQLHMVVRKPRGGQTLQLFFRVVTNEETYRPLGPDVFFDAASHTRITQ